MDASLIDYFNENGFVIAENILKTSEISHYRKILKHAVKFRKQLDKRKLSEKSEYEQSFIQCQNLWEDFPEIRKGGSDSAIKTISYEKVKNAVDQLLKDHAIAP